MPSSRRIAAPLALAVMLHVTFADAALAVTRTWIAGNGQSGVAANWNPAAVPTSSDSCLYDANSAVEVTFDASTTTVRGQLVNWGEMRMNTLAPHTVTGRIHVGRTAAQACTLTLRQADVALTGGIHVGTTNNTTGVLKVQNEISQITGTGANTIRVGENGGTGRLLVRTGGVLDATQGLAVGWNNGNGTIRVTGVSAADSAERSRLQSRTAAGTYPYFGNFGGTGRLEVTEGALAEFDQLVRFGHTSGSTGEFHVGTASTRDSARVRFFDNVHFGDNGTAGSAAGTATATLAGGGVMEVTGATMVGDVDGGGTARLNVRGGARLITRGLYLQGPNAELNHTGGRIQVNGNSLALGSQPLVVNGNSASPRLELSNVTQCTINSASAPAMRIGTTGFGELTLRSSADLRVAGFNALIGDSAGSTGNVEVIGSSSTLTVDDALLVGREGTGTLTVEASGDVIVDQLGVATQPSAVGDVTIDGAGSSMRIFTDLQLAGLSSGGSGAPGSLFVNNQGILHLEGAPISGTIWDTGDLDVYGGSTVNLAGTLVHRGSIGIAAGEIAGGTLQMAGGSINGYGTIASSIVTLLDTTSTITASNTLDLGDATSPLGIFFGGLLDVGANHVTLADADSAVLGTVSIAGGTLTASGSGIHVAANRRIRGHGTIEGNVRPAGRLIATGANGLTLTGLLLNTGQGVNGTKFTFAPGSGFLGNGTIDASVVVDSGATLVPTGFLTMGDAQAVSSVTIDGLLLPGAGVNVQFDGTDSTRVNGRVQLSGGVLIPAFMPLRVRPGGVLSGNGGVGGVFVLGGTVDPGLAGTRKLAFDQFRMQGTGRVQFDVGNLATGQRDTIEAASAATLAGTLDLRLMSGFTPVPGDSFLVISAPTVTGTFASFTVGGQSAAGQFELRYRSNGVWAVVSAIGLDAPAEGAPRALRFAALGSPSRALAFALDLPRASDAMVELFDVSGRRLATLHRGPLAAGAHRLIAEDAAAPEGGLVFARAVIRDAAGTTTRTARAVKLR